MAKKGSFIKIDYFLPLLVVLIFAILILGAEAALRIRYPNLLIETEASNEFPLFCSFHPRLGRWHKKNISYECCGALVTHNRNGLRDQELSYENRGDRERILVLGDSVTWGIGVNDGETFCDFMESGLESTDVINMGVSGFGTGEEFLLLQHEGLRYKPDTVVLFFYIGNDICNTFQPESWDNFSANIFYLEDNELKIKYFKISPLRRIAIFLNEKSSIINFVNKIILKRKPDPELNWVRQLNDQNLQSKSIAYPEYINHTYLESNELEDRRCSEDGESSTCMLFEPSENNYYMVELTKKIILEMKDLCSRNGAELIVILSPPMIQFDPSSCHFKSPLSKELLRFSKSNNIPVLDLFPLLASSDHDPEKIFIDMAHYSVFGHREVAKLILERLPELTSRNID